MNELVYLKYIIWSIYTLKNFNHITRTFNNVLIPNFLLKLS